MRLNLREIIHVPGASLPFQFQLDLSGEDFFGEHPIPRPVTVTGHVKTRRRTTLSSWKTARWTLANWLTPPSS